MEYNKVEDKFKFFQWLNAYEYMTKRQFKELPKYKQENYKKEYEIYLKTKI